jgi:hypothetical protein
VAKVALSVTLATSAFGGVAAMTDQAVDSGSVSVAASWVMQTLSGFRMGSSWS